MSIGQRLLEARLKANLSQSEVAKRIGIHYTTIGKYERDECIPPADKLGQLAEIYHEDVNVLLFGNTRKIINITNLPDYLIDKIYMIIFLEEHEAKKNNGLKK